MAALVQAARCGRLTGATPVAQGAATAPGTGGKTQHLAGHARQVQRPAHHVHQQGNRLALRLHAARAVDQKAHRRIGHWALAFAHKQLPLQRVGHQLRQAAAVDATFVLAVLQVLPARRAQQRLELAHQRLQGHALLGNALVQLQAQGLPLGRTHQIRRLHRAVIGGGEDGVTAQHLVRAQAAARCCDGLVLVLAAFKVDPQRQPLAAGLHRVDARGRGLRLAGHRVLGHAAGNVQGVLAVAGLVVARQAQAAHVVANDFGQGKAGGLDQVHQCLGHGLAHHPCAADQGHRQQREALHGFGQVRLAQRHGPDLETVAQVVRCTGQAQCAGLRLDADLLQHFHDQAFQWHQCLALAQRSVKRCIGMAQTQRRAIAGGAKRAPVVLAMHRVQVGSKVGQAQIVAVQAALAVVQLGLRAQGAGAGRTQIV